MHLLIVEDEESIHAMIKEYLTKKGYTCTSAFSGSEAKLLLAHETFDCMILDLMLPGMSGEQLMKECKALQTFPVIVLSAKDSIDSKVALLQDGADDYMCKPFDLKELEARIHVQIRKHQPKQVERYQFKDVVLHDDYRSVTIGEKTQKLTKHEYKILELLMSNPHRAFTKKAIYEYAWEDMYYGDDKTITVHISNIRNKLQQISKQEYIETIWGIGFKMKV